MSATSEAPSKLLTEFSRLGKGARRFDVEYQVDSYLKSIRGQTFYGEPFPIFSPNLGPNVYAAYYGAELDFGDATSWIRHCVKEAAEVRLLQFSCDNSYFQEMDELTAVAKMAGNNKAMLISQLWMDAQFTTR